MLSGCIVVQGGAASSYRTWSSVAQSRSWSPSSATFPVYMRLDEQGFKKQVKRHIL